MSAAGVEGRVVNIASAAGLASMPQMTAYGMSKAAIIHMTRCLAVEWARFGISVNAICPGYVETELNADFLASEAGQKVIASLPRNRAAQVEDLDAVLLMLLDGQGARCVELAARLFLVITGQRTGRDPGRRRLHPQLTIEGAIACPNRKRSSYHAP